MTMWPTQITYFRPLGQCRCGKPATGWLMGPRNDHYGIACQPCASKALKAADAAKAAN